MKGDTAFIILEVITMLCIIAGVILNYYKFYYLGL